jgi:hypothetical protein
MFRVQLSKNFESHLPSDSIISQQPLYKNLKYCKINFMYDILY